MPFLDRQLIRGSRWLSISATVILAACSSETPRTGADSAHAAAQAPASDLVERRLAVFDTLDFDVFSNQKWERLGESHADDIIVTWPDGHDTKGLATHVEDLKALFVYAPDIQIKEHPIRFGQGDWTAVQGTMTGSFTRPMPVGNGKTVAPTGKSFKLNMATIGHWKDGKMDHEWLFWDNHDFMTQIGLAK